MRYSDFTSKDFILDDFFKSWVLTPDYVSDDFWKNWIKENPNKLMEVEEARQLILQMNFRTHYPSYEEYLNVWNKLSQNIDTYENNKEGKEETSVFRMVPEKNVLRGIERERFKYWRSIAASVIGLIFIASIYFIFLNISRITVQTKYGETKTVVLPDKSIVTLNSNTKIKYSKFLGDGDIREVWIEGEAFFEVKKKVSQAKFIVHTNHLNVEVLGTQFNVSDRNNSTRVILSEGKVKLNIHDTSIEEAVYMKPGELVEFSSTKKQLHKETVNPEKYISWKHNLLIFEDTSLEEIALLLKNNYGYTVEFSEPTLKQKKLVGSFPANDIDELLWNLKKIYGAKVSYEKKYILF